MHKRMKYEAKSSDVIGCKKLMPSDRKKKKLLHELKDPSQP